MVVVKKFYSIVLLAVLLVSLPLELESDAKITVPGGQAITVSARASDKDCHYDSEGCPTTVTDTVTVTWGDDTGRPTNEAFPSGNEGSSVSWTAPPECGDTDVTIYATADDSGIKYDDWPGGDSVTVTVKADTQPEAGWTDYYPNIGGCDASCIGCTPTPCVSTPVTDGCGNNIKVQCGPSPFCLYRYMYNDSTNMSDCVWHNGLNFWQYRKTSDGKRFHSARHATLHQCNSTSCWAYHQVPQKRCGCAPNGFYCWRIKVHDCINNTNISTDWLRSTTKPNISTVWTAGTSHSCPYCCCTPP